MFEDNVATNNTGGFLVFDLPGLRQYGEKNIVRNNKSFANNTENFAPVGNIVGRDAARHRHADPGHRPARNLRQRDLRQRFRRHLHRELRPGRTEPIPISSTTSIPKACISTTTCSATTAAIRRSRILIAAKASLLPLLVNIKNAGRASHIVWDGGVDAANGCTAIPKDADGIPLTRAQCHAIRMRSRVGARMNAVGPTSSREDTVGRLPLERLEIRQRTTDGLTDAEHNRLCIRDNSFQNTKPQTLLTT